MLYDPKWETTVAPVTKPNVYALPTLIAWLETMPAQKEYDYGCNGTCLLARYLFACGWKSPSVGGTVWSDGPLGEDIGIPRSFQRIAIGRPRTFGAALGRALAEEA